MNLVSVIMNCHNGEKFLNDSVKSVINQTYQNWELIFFDNASNDNSKKIIQGFKENRIKYFFSKKFLNLYAARNEAIEKSNGKYISFLDIDDYWAPNKLVEQVKFLENNKEYKIVYSNYYVQNDKKRKKFIKYQNQLPSGLIAQKLLDKYCVGILTVLLEKRFFEKNYFNSNFNIIGDFDFIINLSKKFKIGSIQEPLANYRLHENNFSTKKIELHKKELEFWIKENQNKLSLQNLNLRNQKIYLFKLKFKSFLSKYLKF